jgi:hypothetical protein
MLSKKLVLLFMLVMLLVSLAIPAAAKRSCSGDDCGCGLDGQACTATCAPGQTACFAACRREVVACSKACCIGG